MSGQLPLDDLGNVRRLQERFVQLRPRFMMVTAKSAEVRARPFDAIRLARVRCEGRSRIGELVRVELNRDHSIFDLEAYAVNSVTFERHAVLDSKGRRWRYRDIIAAQARHLREEAKGEGRRALDAETKADLAVVMSIAPQQHSTLVLLNQGSAGGHVVNAVHLEFPSEGSRMVETREPVRLGLIAGPRIVPCEGDTIKRGRS